MSDDTAKETDERERERVCPKCEGTGLHADKKRFCSACLGSGKEEKRPFGWQ